MGGWWPIVRIGVFNLRGEGLRAWFVVTADKRTARVAGRDGRCNKSTLDLVIESLATRDGRLSPLAGFCLFDHCHQRDVGWVSGMLCR